MSIAVSQLLFGLLILLRFIGLLMTAPVLGLGVIQWKIKIALAVTLAFLVSAHMHTSASIPSDLFALGLMGLSEILLGMAIGLVAAMFVHGVRMAAQVAGIQIGLGFAMLVDPMTGDQSSVLARLVGLTAILVIVGFNGHHILIRGLSMSFYRLPPGQAWTSLVVAAQAVPTAGVTLFLTAALVSAPALAAVFCLKIAMALMARSAPQVHILAVGFIVTIVIGVLVVAWSMSGMGNTIRTGFELAARQALELVSAG